MASHGAKRHTQGISTQQIQRTTGLYHRAHPFLRVLPPELIDGSLVAAHRGALESFAGYVLGCALFALAFLAVFALRMRTEFRGENLSDAASAVSAKVPQGAARGAPKVAAAATLAASAGPHAISGGEAVLAILGKEFLYMRRNMGILYGLIMPIVLVLLFASRFAARSNSVWIFPGAIAYTLLAICPLSYNSFGFEATGAQLYYLAPVPMRTVMLAKNLFSFLMAFVEVFAILGIISYIAGMPSLTIAGAAMLWASGTLAINSIFGNMRSFTAPKKVNPQRMPKRQGSQLSAFISLGVVGVSSGIAAGLFLICLWARAVWMMVPAAALFAGIGVVVYTQSLKSMDRFALEHREELFAEICKQS